jgi:Metallo-beta-lactamase superfamily
MEEIEQGLWHWSSIHPNHGMRVSSYAFERGKALIDPLLGEDGDGALDDLPFEPSAIILSCRHHRRSSADLRERFGAEILVPVDGWSEFRDEDGARSYDDGDAVVDGVIAIDIDALSADETALHLDAGPGALLIADGLMRDEYDGEIGFVSDELLGSDPDQVKSDIRAQFALVLESCPPFEHLLFAHGAPIVSDGREALEEFLG